jgi:hypothetical protein
LFDRRPKCHKNPNEYVDFTILVVGTRFAQPAVAFGGAGRASRGILILGRIMSDDFDVEGLFVKILAGALAATFLGGTLAAAVKILVTL